MQRVLRIDERDWAGFEGQLRRNGELEAAGVILAESQEDGVLLARELHLVPEDGYAIRERDQLRIDPVAFNRLVHGARSRSLSVITAHTHPGTTEPWFSHADDVGDSRLMPSLYVQTPGPHGSLVIAGDTGRAMGRVWEERGEFAPLKLSVVGQRLEFSDRPGARARPEWFDRQELALGKAGQRKLRGLHVGVVGAGGTGSVCAMQLAHLGVGQITAVDGDLIEASNLSRVVGAGVGDIGKPKVEVLQRFICGLGLGTEVVALKGNLGTDIEAAKLATCDVILSCVDQHTPRALLNRLAYESLIPVIDLGSVFRTDHTGRISSSAGRVVVVGPGRKCLACWGHIDAHQLATEALSVEELERQAEEGYVQGARVPEPSVIPFNTLVAGAAVVELLRLVTGFAGGDSPPQRLSFDFELGTVRRNKLAHPSSCRICGGVDAT